jgi:hypothetical protein
MREKEKHTIKSMSLLLIRAVFIANILVAGQVGWISLFSPKQAAASIFEGESGTILPVTIVGSFWLAIAALSLIGLFFPLQFSAVLVFQFVYKGIWLLFVALPTVLANRGETLPWGITTFFLIWVIILPFIIPYRYLFNLSIRGLL